MGPTTLTLSSGSRGEQPSVRRLRPPELGLTSGGLRLGQNELMNWSRDALVEGGFTGFVPFAELPSVQVPTGPGVYVVLCPTSVESSFVESSSAGWFKGKDPSVAVAELKRA